MAKMQLPDDVCSVSFNGKQYDPDDNGIVEVPDEAVEDLKSHGLTMAPAETRAAKKASKKGTKE